MSVGIILWGVALSIAVVSFPILILKMRQESDAEINKVVYNIDVPNFYYDDILAITEVDTDFPNYAFLSHHSMNDYQLYCGGNKIEIDFEGFLEVFFKYASEMCPNDRYPHSLFSDDVYLMDRHYIHASIVKVNNNLYYFKSNLDYYKFTLFIKRYTTVLNKHLKSIKKK